MSDFDRAAAALFGGPTPARTQQATSHQQSMATDDQVLAERLYGGKAEPRKPVTTGP